MHTTHPSSRTRLALHHQRPISAHHWINCQALGQTPRLHQQVPRTPSSETQRMRSSRNSMTNLNRASGVTGLPCDLLTKRSERPCLSLMISCLMTSRPWKFTSLPHQWPLLTSRIMLPLALCRISADPCHRPRSPHPRVQYGLHRIGPRQSVQHYQRSTKHRWLAQILCIPRVRMRLCRMARTLIRTPSRPRLSLRLSFQHTGTIPLENALALVDVFG
jgi:hypothetical protein